MSLERLTRRWLLCRYQKKVAQHAMLATKCLNLLNKHSLAIRTLKKCTTAIRTYELLLDLAKARHE
eukprot:12379050-Prorocentrum_lima.AAC.1